MFFIIIIMYYLRLHFSVTAYLLMAETNLKDLTGQLKYLYGINMNDIIL